MVRVEIMVRVKGQGQVMVTVIFRVRVRIRTAGQDKVSLLPGQNRHVWSIFFCHVSC